MLEQRRDVDLAGRRPGEGAGLGGGAAGSASWIQPAPRLLSLSTRPRLRAMTAAPAALAWSTDNCTVGRAMEVLGERLDLRRAARGLQRRTPLRRHAPPLRHPAPGAHRPARAARRRRHPPPRALPRAGPARAPRVPPDRQGLRPLPRARRRPARGATATSPTPRARPSSSSTSAAARRSTSCCAAATATRSTGRRDVATRPGPGDQALRPEGSAQPLGDGSRGGDHLRRHDVLVDGAVEGHDADARARVPRRPARERRGRGRRSAARRS